MIDFFSYPFFQSALLVGVIVAVISAYFGCFVVQRGLSFLGNGLAHAAFGGIALGLIFSSQPLPIALVFTVGVSVAIVWLQQNSKLSPDTIIGVLFSLAMAMGIILMRTQKQYSGDAMTYLFGSLMGVSRTDILLSVVMLGLTGMSAYFWGTWALASFDRELALAEKIPCQRDDYFLAASIAVTVVLAAKIVGVLLISAFLVIPAASARFLAKTFRSMTLLAIAMSVVSVLGGMMTAVVLNWPAGPAIIAVQSLIFFLCFGTTFLKRN